MLDNNFCLSDRLSILVADMIDPHFFLCCIVFEIITGFSPSQPVAELLSSCKHIESIMITNNSLFLYNEHMTPVT